MPAYITENHEYNENDEKETREFWPYFSLVLTKVPGQIKCKVETLDWLKKYIYHTSN